jgi:hypothetical protein
MQHSTLARYGRMLMLLAGLLGTSVAWAQYTVSGQVKTSNGQGLPGVNLVIRGTTSGASTDAKGNYQLNVRENGPAFIVVSAVGYLSQTIQVRGAGRTDVTLEEDVNNLDEVVVTGLASSIKRSNLANAVTTISAQQLLGTTQIQTTDGALYGKVPGANININSGAPGGGGFGTVAGHLVAGGGFAATLHC